MKSHHIIGIIGWIIVALLQVTLMGNVRIGYSEGNIIVACLVLALFLSPQRSYMWYGIIASGMIADLLSPFRFGLVTLTLLAVAWVLVLIQRRFVQYLSFVLLMIACFIAAALYDVFMQLLLGFIGTMPVSQVVGDGVLTSIVGAVIYVGLRLVDAFQRDLRVNAETPPHESRKFHRSILFDDALVVKRTKESA